MLDLRIFASRISHCEDSRRNQCKLHSNRIGCFFWKAKAVAVSAIYFRAMTGPKVCEQQYLRWGEAFALSRGESVRCLPFVLLQTQEFGGGVMDQPSKLWKRTSSITKRHISSVSTRPSPSRSASPLSPRSRQKPKTDPSTFPFRYSNAASSGEALVIVIKVGDTLAGTNVT